jgi:uncharacterized membrane-anchored protein
MTLKAFVLLLIVLGLSSVAVAQQPQSDLDAQFAALNWQHGPTKGDLGGIATLVVPEGYQFLGKGDAVKFMELNENPTDGSELGVLVPEDGSWFVVYEFSADGYVKDDDRDLDAGVLLASIRRGTAAANEIRRQKGWATLEILGWQQQPFYDTATNNLTWSIRGSSEGSTSVNHSTRLLGRRGVMRVNLVAGPEDLGKAVPDFNSVMRGFTSTLARRTRSSSVATRSQNTG